MLPTPPAPLPAFVPSLPHPSLTCPLCPPTAPSQRVHKARSGRGASPKSKPDLIQCPACEGGVPPTSLSQRGGQQEQECDDDGVGKREQEQRVWLVAGHSFPFRHSSSQRNLGGRVVHTEVRLVLPDLCSWGSGCGVDRNHENKNVYLRC
ncbi:hypothetical protein E2C01_056226 [Portunus trituberculatus]|uniref:Uncharacterized protein n=1 Tax=Portunus trituberculatus TaxID=210409 RepID=A0A5B7GWS9_PORTR|nr:hypothetical protein [Portunus trituberculatus]